MYGFCSWCKEYRGDGEEWGIVIRRNDDFPVCDKCGHFVDLFDTGEEKE